MALKIMLKPQERMILGGAVVSNGNSTGCQLIIENKVPILREKDIISESAADTPCRQLHFIIQLMYIDDEGNLAIHQKNYWRLVNEIINAAPSTIGLIDAINEGYTDLEELRRKLRIGMGPCQGRVCISLVKNILERETKRKVSEE